MRAMSWWDHETDSIWSQPWGLAIHGPLEGTRLKMIPASIIPWEAWLAEHPDTMVLQVGQPGAYYGTMPRADQVIGIALGEFAKGYTFSTVSKPGLVNDSIGPFPVVVVADAETKATYVYLRTVGGRELEFALRDGRIVDRETGSTWDIAIGLAVDGPLKGKLLKQIPYMTAYDWAWLDFYPHSDLYTENS